MADANLNFGGILSMVRYFTGEPGTTAIRDFITSIETASELGGWTPAMRIAVLKGRIQGPALDFFNSNRNIQGADWDVLKNAFLAWFQEESPHIDPLATFYSCIQRPGESVKNFVVRLKLAGKAAIPATMNDADRATRQTLVDNALLPNFTKGLREECGAKIISLLLTNNLNPTLEDAVKLALDFEANGKRVQKIRSIEERDNAAVVHALSQISAGPSYHHAKQDKPRNKEKSTDQDFNTALIKRLEKMEASLKSMQLSVEQSSKNSTQGQAFYRERQGPSRYGQPQPRYPRQDKPFDYSRAQCFQCGKFGHFARDCYNRPNFERQINFQGSNQGTKQGNDQGNSQGNPRGNKNNDQATNSNQGQNQNFGNSSG